MFQLKMSKIFFLAVLAVLTASCMQHETGHDNETDQLSQKHPQKTVKAGPPAHAPVHGYRKKHTYKYYPECRVYHSKEQNAYFWFKNGKWEVGVTLPSSISIYGHSSVSVELESDKPYLHHGTVEKEHPGKGKAKGKYKNKNKGKYK